MFALVRATRTEKNRFPPNLACLFLETRKIFLKCQSSEKVSAVRNVVRVISVPRRLSTTDSRRKDHKCLGEKIDLTKITNPTTVLGLSQGKMASL